jgi:DNA-binding MarR family transcriptional regulator
MSGDIVRTLGLLTLGSRLKRIGERLQSDTQRIFRSEGVDLPPALMPTLKAIHRDGAITVGGIAESLGIAQPGATRNVAQLQRQGLVQTLKRGRDQRVRTIALTAKGRALMERTIATIEPRVLGAVAEICNSLQGPLLAQLDALEDALAATPLDRRGARRRTGEGT